MRIGSICVTLALATSIARAEPDDERIRKRFESANYTVTWGDVAAFDAAAELETGDGYGHGGTLAWMRFQPGQDGVRVLSIRLDLGHGPHGSKWPPDAAPVEVTRAVLKPQAYARLLRSLAVVDAARLAPVDQGYSWSSNNFWVNAQLRADQQVLLDLNWSGYQSRGTEVEYAKPLAAVTVARAARGELDFAEHALTDEDRRWASAKFVRDLKKFDAIEKVKGRELSHWWVRERYIITIGVIGDAAALPTLRDILANAPAERHKHDTPGIDMSKSQDSLVYHAINAITRLTKKDVRPQPVEEMDVEATRRKVLDLMDGK